MGVRSCLRYLVVVGFLVYLMFLIFFMFLFFFFKQKTAYEMRISDWSSDVCSSDLQDSTWLASRRPQRSFAATGRGVGAACASCTGYSGEPWLSADHAAAR